MTPAGIVSLLPVSFLLWLPVKALLFYGLLARGLVVAGVLAAFWPDEPEFGFNANLAVTFGAFFRWVLSRNPGRHASRGKERRWFRRPRHAAVTA